MPFRPNSGDTLTIDGALYSVAEHPFARGMPYGQEGRAATVYQLVGGRDKRAIKVFKPRFQVPALVILSERLEAFASLPGLRVCSRSVITARRHIQLVREYPDLNYAVVMPWVEGPTWMEVLLNKGEFSHDQSLAIAHGLVEVLANMEERGLSHCDMSGPNMLLPGLVDEGLRAKDEGAVASVIELVDVEQMYGEDLKRPEIVPGGSAGYAHKTAPEGLWSPVADRFAGALLISEMLGWCDIGVREAAWGESYFDPQEMQKDSERYRVLTRALREQWGARLAHLLEQAWESDTLADCPTFGRWLAELPDAATVAPSNKIVKAEVNNMNVDSSGRESVQAILERAQELEGSGNLAGALDAYQEALVSVPSESGLASELAMIVSHLEASIAGSRQESVSSVLERAQQLEAEGNLRGALGVYREALALTPPESGLASELAMIIDHIQLSAHAQGVVSAGGVMESAQAPPAQASVPDSPYRSEPPIQPQPSEPSLQAVPEPDITQSSQPTTSQPASAPMEVEGQIVEQPVPVQAPVYQPKSYPLPQPPAMQDVQPPVQPQVYQPASYAPPPQQPVAQYQPMVGPAGPVASQVVQTRKGGSAGRIIAPLVLVGLLLLGGMAAFLALSNRGGSKGAVPSTATAMAGLTPTLGSVASVEGTALLTVESRVTETVTPHEATGGEPTVPSQNDQPEKQLPEALGRNFKYADLVFTVTKAVISSKDTYGQPLNPGKAKLNMTVSVENPTESAIQINTGLLKLTSRDGAVYKDPEYIGVSARDTQEIKVSFDVPAAATWDGARLSFDEVGKEPVTLQLSGTTPTPQYPLTVTVSGEASLKNPEVTYKLVRAVVDLDGMGKRAELGKRYVLLAVLVSSNEKNGAVISATNFRLVVDGKTIGADSVSPVSEALYVLQEKEFHAAFLVPDSVTKAELEVGELGKEAARIPIDSGGSSATPPAATPTK